MSLVQKITRFVAGTPASQPRPASVSDLPVTTGGEGFLHIPMPNPTGEDNVRDSWQQRGQRLARQEDWQTLSRELKAADTNRSLTPGGMSVAELMAYGARADVVGAVEHALLDGRPDSDAPLLAGIEALESVLSEYDTDYTIALIVAQAHMDIAWAWRGNGYDAQVPTLNMEAFEAHMDRAADILSPFCGREIGSPSLMSACCALMQRKVGRARSADDVSQSYEALIDVNPMDTRQMRALGTAMLPRWFGAYDRLELEAHRTAARLHEIWGAGGYTWVMLDAISNDVQALAGLDVDYFTDGIRDILALRPDQFTVNLLAAYCAVTMTGDSGNDSADFNRQRIHACRNWIICDYMTELHPLIWAHATRGFDNTVRIRSIERFALRGSDEAHRVLKSLFLPELARGQNVVFTKDGPVTSLP